MPIDWNSVTGGAGALTPAQQAQRVAAAAAATMAAANAARRAAATGNATAAVVVATARAAAAGAWRGVTGSADGYAQEEVGILQRAAYGVQDVTSILTLGAVPPGTPGATTWTGTASEALQAAASNVLPLGVGAGLGVLAGSGGVILIGAAVLLAVVLLKR